MSDESPYFADSLRMVAEVSPDLARPRGHLPRFHRYFPLILVVTIVVHLAVLWTLHDLSVFSVPQAELERISVSQFVTEFIPESKIQGQPSRLAESQFILSTQVIPVSPVTRSTANSPILSGGDAASTDNARSVGSPEASSPTVQAIPNLRKVAVTNQSGEASLFNVKISSHRVVYLLDYSGSMWNKLGSSTRFDQATTELRKSIRSLPPDTEFNIVVFADRPVAFHPHLVLADDTSKAEAQTFLATMPYQEGTTDLVAGLDAAFALRPDSVFLLTDGLPNMADWKFIEQLRLVQKKHAPTAKLYTVGMIEPSETESIQFLKKLARLNSGQFIPSSGSFKTTPE